MTSHGASTPPSRRSLLKGSAAVGAGTVGSLVAAERTAQAHPAGSRVVAAAARPAATERQFTLAVMPDTQYLFDETSLHGDPVVASLDYLRRERDRQNIAFLAHLGDLTQNGQPQEMDAFAAAWTHQRRLGIPSSTLAGNHDVPGKSTDQRGDTAYLRHFRASTSRPGCVAASADGYNSAYRFTAAGREWLVLALDWRLSPQGFAWAKDVLARHRHTPTILTTHEIVNADTGDGVGVLSAYGQQLWDQLIRDNDQVFLAMGGHFWPTGRLTKSNAAGHEVHLHLANYQEKYYGGAAMLRLYRFDLERGVIDVETLAPWVERVDPERRNELMQEELVITGDADRFSIDIDFDTRFAAFAPAPVRPARAAGRMLVSGTLAYWRWDQGAVGAGSRVRDLSGHGNDLEVVTNGAAPLTVVDDFHPEQPAHRSLQIGGPLSGSYLRTVATAPLNGETFRRGYTFEAFFHLPAQWERRNAWSALFSREGTCAEAGKQPGDADEPVVTMSLSGSRELQWCVYPVTLPTSTTNWSHELRVARWWHVAVVNDGRHTVLYVDGCPVVRNPATPNSGLTTLGKRWLVGGYEYGGALDKVFEGRLGDIRVVGRALQPREFMNAR